MAVVAIYEGALVQGVVDGNLGDFRCYAVQKIT